MTVQLGPADSGARSVVAVGERIHLRLPENPTTGYEWQPEFDESRVTLLDDQFAAAEMPRGSGGQRSLVFQPLRPGPAAIKLCKRRSWESGPPAEEYSVELDVQPAQTAP
jgi:inhibitor of cysteine peptidase